MSIGDDMKSPSASAVSQNIYKVFPNDLNSSYSIFGGIVMSICDRTALVVAERHSAQVCVTASVDSMHFVAPAKLGDTLMFSASINRAWSSSMEIGVKVLAENSFTGENRHIVSAYFSFVALDKNNEPTSVPEVLPETPDQQRRYAAAQVRRDARLQTVKQLQGLK
jgi:hypothetical protein